MPNSVGAPEPDVADSSTRGTAAGRALTLRGLCKQFGDSPALIDVDLHVAPGEVHALLGQNGSGKSTLVKILAGYHHPDAGTGEVGGETVALGNPEAAHAAGLRFVHQDLAVVDTLSTIENLALGRGYETRAGCWISWKAETKHAQQAIEAIGSDFDVKRPVGELPPSQRVAVAVARALQDWRAEASLIVLDEPTAALPPPEVEQIFAMIHRIRARNVGVIFISHRLDEVMTIADRVTVLRDGRVIGTHAVSELNDSQLVELIVGQALAVGESTRDATVAKGQLMTVSGLQGGQLREASFELARGEILGVAGINGSGREEVARLLFGDGARTRGQVVVDSTELPSGRPDVSVHRGVGYVPSDRKRRAALMGLTVRENLSLADLGPYTTRGRLRRRREREDALNWLKRLDVRPLSTEAPLWTLSGGNQQKVMIARWLKLKPKVLVLDEPTQGVDVSAKEQIYALIEGATKEGLAVVTCSSEARELERLCDRVLVLREGRVVTELAGDGVTKTAIDHAVLSGTTSQEAA